MQEKQSHDPEPRAPLELPPKLELDKDTRKQRRFDFWPYVVLPILITMVVLLTIQNTYLTEVDRKRNAQYNDLAATQRDILRQIEKQGDRAADRDDDGSTNTGSSGSPQAGGSTGSTATKEPVATSPRRNETQGQAGGNSGNTPGGNTTPDNDNDLITIDPSPLCIRPLPLFCTN